MTTASPRPDRRAGRDRLLFAAVLAASAVVLFVPSPPTPALFPYADTVVHLVLFAALGLSGRRAGVTELTMALALAVYAGTSEVVQTTLLTGRSGSWADVGADLAGAAVGLLAARIHRRPT